MTKELQRHADIAFLALTIWRESRGEPLVVRTGVAFVILNRTARPSWWGRDVMSVVFKKWQFSSLTDPKDKQLTTWPSSEDKTWQECLDIAQSAIEGTIANPVPGANHYYDSSISPPKWADEKRLVKKIGRIFFYNLA